MESFNKINRTREDTPQVMNQPIVTHKPGRPVQESRILAAKGRKVIAVIEVQQLLRRNRSEVTIDNTERVISHK